MKDDVAELESQEDRTSNDAVTGVRKTDAARDPDSPTEEIEIESVDLNLASLPIVTPDAESRSRKTSVPPPLPAAALRLRATLIPPAADLKARLRPPAPLGQRATPAPRSSPPPLPAAGAEPISRSVPPPLPAAGTSEAIHPPVIVPRVPAEVETVREELDRLSKRMRERDAYLGELEAVYTQRSEALLAAQAKLEEQQVELDARAARIKELETALATRSTQQLVGPLDDLTRIRGIGPHYARLLQGFGVQSFAAIAAWTPEQCAHFARELKVNPGRVERDRWVEQARALCDKASLVTPSDEL